MPFSHVRCKLDYSNSSFYLLVMLGKSFYKEECWLLLKRKYLTLGFLIALLKWSGLGLKTRITDENENVNGYYTVTGLIMKRSHISRPIFCDRIRVYLLNIAFSVQYGIQFDYVKFRVCELFW